MEFQDLLHVVSCEQSIKAGLLEVRHRSGKCVVVGGEYSVHVRPLKSRLQPRCFHSLHKSGQCCPCSSLHKVLELRRAQHAPRDVDHPISRGDSRGHLSATHGHSRCRVVNHRHLDPDPSSNLVVVWKDRVGEDVVQQHVLQVRHVQESLLVDVLLGEVSIERVVVGGQHTKSEAFFVEAQARQNAAGLLQRLNEDGQGGLRGQCLLERKREKHLVHRVDHPIRSGNLRPHLSLTNHRLSPLLADHDATPEHGRVAARRQIRRLLLSRHHVILQDVLQVIPVQHFVQILGV
mmetsp:Transcript_759/g.1738  ORF Transcript_759/g.1738 Transcript_759/m.1738 type:complete len:291 (+) Transcript_759:796-1668(+)